MAAFKSKKPSMPAAIILALTAITLAMFEIADNSKARVPVEMNSQSPEQAGAAGTPLPISFDEQLSEVLVSVKKTPFKAKVTTESGFKGYWIQSGDSYRFEDADKQNILIYNSTHKKLWVIDMPRKIAVETVCDTATADYYEKINPAVFIEGFGNVDGSVTRKLEEMLPSGDKARLSFTEQGLPDRWESRKSDGKPYFIDWEYEQTGNISATEFDLPDGISIHK